jgi:hypothetical protein
VVQIVNDIQGKQDSFLKVAAINQSLVGASSQTLAKENLELVVPGVDGV